MEVLFSSASLEIDRDIGSLKKLIHTTHAVTTESIMHTQLESLIHERGLTVSMVAAVHVQEIP